MRVTARGHRFARRGGDGRTTVAAALTTFTLAGLVATIVLGAAGVYALQRAGRDDATKDAKRVTAIVGDGIIQPHLTPELMRGDPEAIAALDRAVRRNVLRDPVVRVKVWTPDGRIIYSDEHRLIGRRYTVSPDDQAILKKGGVEAELSDLSRPENRYEPSGERLLEVYLPLRTPGGQLVRFESYQRFDSVLANGRQTWKAFLPALIGGLVILQLVQLPLAARLARRIERGRREREALLRRAVDASDAERRRIAADLHDGVVQSLAGVSYSLSAAADRIAAKGGNGSNGGRGGVATGDDAGVEVLRRGADATRESIAELRTLLVDIYPPNLQSAGLRSALEDLVAPLGRGGCQVHVDITAEPLPPGVEALFFRVAQEALRNMSKHAEASSVTLTVERAGETARLVVEDDGRGFDPAAVQEVQREGHVGLRVLADLVHDAGGELTIDSEPARGTRVEAEVVLA